MDYVNLLFLGFVVAWFDYDSSFFENKKKQQLFDSFYFFRFSFIRDTIYIYLFISRLQTKTIIQKKQHCTFVIIFFISNFNSFNELNTANKHAKKVSNLLWLTQQRFMAFH